MVPIASMEVVLNNQLTYLELSTDGINRIKETELYLVPNLDTYKELDFNETKLLGSAGFLCDTRLETGEFVSRFPINNVEINSDNNGNNDNNYDRILEGDYDD